MCILGPACLDDTCPDIGMQGDNHEQVASSIHGFSIVTVTISNCNHAMNATCVRILVQGASGHDYCMLQISPLHMYMRSGFHIFKTSESV